MTNNLERFSDVQLIELHERCTETIETVFSRLERDQSMTDVLRKLLKADGLLGKFQELLLEDEANAELILHASIAVLVNSQSVRAIQKERLSRRKDWN